jgi:Tol biopolymer transport system component
VYVADQAADDTFEMYSVPVGGGAVVKLNGALVAGGDVLPNDFVISPNSNYVAYIADQQTNDQYELYRVPIAGGAVLKLNAPLAPGRDVDAFGTLITPDGLHVVFRADLDTDDVFDIYRVPLAGGANLRLNGTLTAGGYVFQFRPTPDSSRLVYAAFQNSVDVLEVFSVPLAGGPVTPVSGPLVTGGSVLFQFLISPSGQQVVYVADGEVDEVNELYVSADEAVRLYLPLIIR